MTTISAQSGRVDKRSASTAKQSNCNSAPSEKTPCVIVHEAQRSNVGRSVLTTPFLI